MDAQWLQTKTAGLPRWAWITLFGGAVIVGLYVRSRNTESEEEGLEEPEPEEIGLSQYDGTETAGSLGSVGLAGPASAQVLPVEAPFVPDALTEALTSLVGSNIEGQQALSQIASDALNREPNERVEVINERAPSESDQGSRHVTGGGAPKRKPHHKPPKKHAPRQKKQPARKKQRQKKQPKQRGGARGNRNAPHNTGRRGSGHRAR